MGVTKIVSEWWRDPMDYRWLVSTFESRGALPVMRAVVAANAAGLATITLMGLMTHDGPAGIWRWVAVIDAMTAAPWVVYWLLARWPSERLSLALMAVADVLITIGSLADSNRLFGALAAMLLVITGGYLSIFHGPRVLAAHGCWSLVSVLTLAWLIGRGADSDRPEAASMVVTMAAVTVGLLPALHFCYWVLRMDALTDPLTGLLNRRGLDYYVSRWFGPADSPICVITVDLDRFKKVNDMYGHIAGDTVLVQVGACLQADRPPESAVARSGGEEFVVVARMSADAAVDAAERLRRAVQLADGTVTASIGVAAADDASQCDLRRLLASSDSAMYRAKRKGGNNVVLAV